MAAEKGDASAPLLPKLLVVGLFMAIAGVLIITIATVKLPSPNHGPLKNGLTEKPMAEISALEAIKQPQVEANGLTRLKTFPVSYRRLLKEAKTSPNAVQQYNIDGRAKAPAPAKPKAGLGDVFEHKSTVYPSTSPPGPHG